MNDLPIAPHGARGHEAQRALLLELVVDPPDVGDDLQTLERRLELRSRELDRALRALVAAGLARTAGDRVWPSIAARSFETLLPSLIR
jgi:hypothetical protein